MKGVLSLFCMFCISLSYASEPVFYLDFDRNIRPVRDKAGTEVRFETAPEYRPGIRGQALLVGTDEKGTRYGLRCSRAGNLNWEKGSISFWVRPENWGGRDSGFFATLFNAGSATQAFRIYKYYEGETFFFMRGPHSKWLRSQYGVGEWQQGEWHHVVCTWDKIQQTLYIDGRLISELAVSTPQPDSNTATFTIGELKGELLFKGKGRLSLVDEFKIFDTVLELKEVQALYARENSGLLPKQRITLGKAPADFSSRGLSRTDNNELAFENAVYTLKRDADHLYLSLQCAELKGEKTFAVFRVPGEAGETVKLLRETAPGKYETAVPLKELPLLKAGKMMLFNLHCGKYDLNGFSRLVPDDGAPAIHLREIFDFEKNMYSVRARQTAGTELSIDGDAYVEIGHFHRKGNLSEEDYFTRHPLGPWQIVTIRFVKNGKVLYRVHYSVRLKTPLSIRYMYTLLKSRELLVSFQGKAKGTLFADFSQGGKTVKTFRHELDGSAGFFRIRYPVEGLAPENYTVIFRFGDARGNTREFARQEYRIAAENDPLIKPYIDPDRDQVPPGFEPVKVQGNTVTLYSRNIDLGQGVLFRSLFSKGRELLKRPDAVIVGGKRLVPAGVQVKMLSATPLTAEYEKILDYADFSLKNRIRIHFDGYMQIRMAIIPKKKLRIESFVYEIPFDTERIRLFRPPEAVTPLAGTVGKTLEYHFNGNAVFWIGDYFRGINFTAENLLHWTFRPAHPHVSVVRERDTAYMRFHFMSVPQTIQQEYDFVFGLTLTPVKAVDRKIMCLRDGIDYQRWYQPWKWFNRLDPADVTPYGIELYEQMRAKKQPFFYYSAYNFCSPCSPEIIWYDELWRQIAHGHTYGEYIGKWNQPEYVYSEGCICCEGYRNYLLNNMNRFISAKKNLVGSGAPKNLYFDAMWEESCENAHHGCTLWTDFNGQKRRHMLIDRYRELAMDIWRIVKRQKGMVRIHMEWPKILQCHAYADMLAGGEIQEAAVAKQEGYFDVMTPAAFCVSYSPYIHSAKTVFIQQILRSLTTNAPAKLQDYDLRKPKWRRATIHSIGLAAVHDVDINVFDKVNPLLELYRETQDRLGWNEHVRFFPYFAEDPVIRLEPVSERIVGSAYANDGKLMLCLLNDTDRETPVAVSLDLRRMGVDAKMVSGKDVYHDKTGIPLREKMTFTLEPREFRLLIFAPEKTAGESCGPEK